MSGLCIYHGGCTDEAKQGEYQHRFTCYLCGKTFYSRPEDDESCRQAFIERYGHTPEETTDDDLVSLCDSCNEYKAWCDEQI